MAILTSDAVTAYRTVINGLAGTYKTISTVEMAIDNAIVSATTKPQLAIMASHATQAGNSGTAAGVEVIILMLTAADYTVPGMTTKLRVRGTTLTNATAPAANFTFGLYPATVGSSGAGAGAQINTGTVVSGSTVTRTAPAASSAFVDSSADFTFPSDGLYALGCILSATPAANSFTGCIIELEVRHV